MTIWLLHAGLMEMEAKAVSRSVKGLSMIPVPIDLSYLESTQSKKMVVVG